MKKISAGLSVLFMLILVLMAAGCSNPASSGGPKYYYEKGEITKTVSEQLINGDPLSVWYELCKNGAISARYIKKGLNLSAVTMELNNQKDNHEGINYVMNQTSKNNFINNLKSSGGYITIYTIADKARYFYIYCIDEDIM